MKKTISALLLAAICMISLSACGEKGGPLQETPLLETEREGAPAPAEDVPQTTPAEEPEEKLTEPEETPTTEPQVQKIRYICVKTEGLNIRSGAGTSFPIIGQAQKNILLGLDGEENGWLRTWYLGRTAYVSANAQYVGFFSMEQADERVEKVIAEGLRLLGTPYVYGAVRLHDGKGNFLKGFKADAFDCSSLMQYIFYYGAGIRLDVTTRTQVLQGVEIPRGEIGRGDLLFFTNASRRNKTGIERVGHVALYLGENYILHTASDFAKIEEISPARWENFLTARRVL